MFGHHATAHTKAFHESVLVNIWVPWCIRLWVVLHSINIVKLSGAILKYFPCYLYVCKLDSSNTSRLGSSNTSPKLRM